MERPYLRAKKTNAQVTRQFHCRSGLRQFHCDNLTNKYKALLIGVEDVFGYKKFYLAKAFKSR